MKKHPILAHISEHTWLWIAILATLGVILFVLGVSTPAAFAFMLVGILIIVKSQGTDVLTIVTADPTVADRAGQDSAPEPATARENQAA